MSRRLAPEFGVHRRIESAESMESGGFHAKNAFHSPEWDPPKLDPAALHGLPGFWVELTQPFTEASPAGVLVSVLVAFGSAVGRGPFVQVGATRHHAHDFAVLVGPTATGRKGDAMNLGMRPLRLADPGWEPRIVRGFGSGEAIVAEVADPADENTAPPDKRLLVFEDELAHPLAVASRDGSTLSPLLRSAWDGGRLENRTRGRKLVGSDAHVSILAGATPDELVRRVSATEVANGFLNRFLVSAVLRTKYLPEPPPLRGDIEAPYVEAFRQAIAHARKAGELRRDRNASERWADLYESELSIDRPGLAGAACSRAEAHTLRLSMLYALLACSDTIQVAHVEAAFALWRYCEQSALLVFGYRLGDPDSDLILDALRATNGAGLTRSEIRDLFSQHRTRAQLDLTLARLEQQRLVTVEHEQTGGRPTTRYRPREEGA